VLHADLVTDAIAREILNHGVTHLQLTPSLARMLATDPRSLAALGSLKKLLLGGEELPASLVHRLRGSTTADIYNMYGPTETTVWSTAYLIPESADFGNVVPIGRPLGNTRAYILDSQLQLIAEGEPGELFLGGPGVARGYLDRPDLTAERFVPDHFASAHSPGSFARDVRTQTAGRRRVGRWSRFGPAERARHSLSLLGSMGTYSPSTKWRAISAKTNLCTGWYRGVWTGLNHTTHAWKTWLPIMSMRSAISSPRVRIAWSDTRSAGSSHSR
jgi:acyl-CoA synthetase (AMP-forming)/AMP-acid ligase II